VVLIAHLEGLGQYVDTVDHDGKDNRIVEVRLVADHRHAGVWYSTGIIEIGGVSNTERAWAAVRAE